MAATASLVSKASEMSANDPPKKPFLKTLTESSDAPTFIPSDYTFNENTQNASDCDNLLPIIDYSLLTSGDPDERSKAIQDLGKACEDWGFFMLINHCMPESLMKEIIEVSKEFFDLSEEEKVQYEGKLALDPIRCGTSSSAVALQVLFWRDYFKIRTHPDFYSPTKPARLRDVASEYCKKTREMVRELLKGISESLGMEDTYIEKKMNLDSGFQQFAANLYPPCPRPDQAIGLPQHTDHGLLTFLIQNGVGGLQVQHKGQWVNVNAIPNSIIVNTADQLEIMSNGKYKSVVHRAVVNGTTERISLASPNGPSLDTLVIPASEFVDAEKNPPAYSGMTYKEYLELQDSGKLRIKPCLDWVRI